MTGFSTTKKNVAYLSKVRHIFLSDTVFRETALNVLDYGGHIIYAVLGCFLYARFLQKDYWCRLII